MTENAGNEKVGEGSDQLAHGDKAEWTYVTSIKFGKDDKIPVKWMLEYEKAKYKKGIVPLIKQLEKEIKTKKKDVPKAERYSAYLDDLFKAKLNGRRLTIEYENGEIYPKNIPPPNIVYIQEPEPHVLITGESDSEKDWYKLHDIIRDFAEEAFLTYEMGCWLASISSSINCCEYILKYELFRRLKDSDKNKLQSVISDRYLTLGNLIKKPSYDCLGTLGIRNFYSKLDYLNDVRVSIYHNNQEKARKVKQRGELEVERRAPITDQMAIPIIAFRVYKIMLDLINHFYNKEKALEYYNEGVADWKRKRKLIGKRI